jgi:hypothetical protein
MNPAEMIRILLVKRGNVSEAELARRLGQSPQNFNKKMKRESFTLADLDTIAGCLGCRLSVQFVDTDTGAVLVDRIPY